MISTQPVTLLGSSSTHLPHRTVCLVVLMASLSMAGATGCAADEDAQAFSVARQIEDRDDLIGGIRSLGEVGDFLLENDEVRIIIHAPGFSRGFGVFGGSLIDADRRRPTESGTQAGGDGNDLFGEITPAFFLQAVAADQVEVVNDGADGGAAVIRASGYGGEFLTMMGILDRAATGSHEAYLDAESEFQLRYEVDYILAPGDSYVTVTMRVINITEQDFLFPGSDAESLLTLIGLDLEGFTLPLGDLAIFGDVSPIFVPGAGFDLRFALDEVYARNIAWPAFPGLVAEWIATRGEAANVSYGLMPAASERNYVWNKREVYDDGRTPITQTSMLIPFSSSGIMAVFYNDAPPTLDAGQSFEVTKYFIIGDGDVGSVLDVVNELQGINTGSVGGVVVDVVSGQEVDNLGVLVHQRLSDGTRRIYSQYTTRGGQFSGTLAPGPYSAQVQGDGRPLGVFVDFEIQAGVHTGLFLTSEAAGRIVATVVDSDGERLPARVSAVGTYSASHAGDLTREFLFDLAAGERYRFSDLVPDDANDSSTLRYVEDYEDTDDGVAELLVRPGTYEVYASRGLEYDVVVETVTVLPGQTASVGAALTRVVDTSGWIAADLHIHTVNSVDSGHPIEDQLRALAAFGVEWAVATDHNYITDFRPDIDRLGLRQWLSSATGLEMSTIESGHFNGYPLRYDVGNITHGSFDWVNRPPAEIFADLRSMGQYGPENTLVQVNHPRDTIQGYFSQYNRDALTASYVAPDFLSSFLSPSGPAFFQDNETAYSEDFDVLEVITGKRLELIHHFRVPETLPPGEVPERLPPAGSILLDSSNEVAFPGAVDDWYNLLNQGHRYIAVGNSDSHLSFDEPGIPRTMIYTGFDDPQQIDNLAMVQSMRSRRVTVTTGPIVDFWIDDPTAGAMGSTIVSGDGSVQLSLSVTGAPWVSVSRINIMRNGLVARSIDVDPNRDLSSDPFSEAIEIEMESSGDGFRDSWFLVEVIGFGNYFPMVLPLELPALVLSDAVASVAEPFGFAGDDFGAVEPRDSFPLSAYALTNPVWVTTGDHEFEAPGVTPTAVWTSPDTDPGFDPWQIGSRSLVTEDAFTGAQNTRMVGSVEPLREANEAFTFPRAPNNPYDIRAIFRAFGHRH